MRRFAKVAMLAVLILSGLTSACWLAVNDADDLTWVRSQESIQREMSKEFPPGSSWDSVIKTLGESALPMSISPSTGLFSGGRTIGSRHARFELGEYRLPLATVSVVASFAFDQEGKLLEIQVRKDIDSL